MHLYCTGSGSPTIVLEAGWGVSTPVMGWGNFQPDLAKITRVCSYDRAAWAGASRSRAWATPSTLPPTCMNCSRRLE
jgi:hypothetical protein